MNTTKSGRSKEVLQALIQGIDPETGGELTQDTVLNRADVMRALLTAVSALDSEAARAARRAQLPKSVGKTWGEEEEQKLKAEYQAKTPISDIAAKHDRTVRAIEARLEKLGLIRPDQRTTGNSFLTPNPPRKERKA